LVDALLLKEYAAFGFFANYGQYSLYYDWFMVIKELSNKGLESLEDVVGKVDSVFWMRIRDREDVPKIDVSNGLTEKVMKELAL
jgi:hypothetical protein